MNVARQRRLVEKQDRFHQILAGVANATDRAVQQVVVLFAQDLPHLRIGRERLPRREVRFRDQIVNQHLMIEDEVCDDIAVLRQIGRPRNALRNSRLIQTG